VLGTSGLRVVSLSPMCLAVQDLENFRPLVFVEQKVPRHVWRTTYRPLHGVETVFSAKLQDSLLDK